MSILVPLPWDRQPDGPAQIAERFRASCVHAFLGSSATTGHVTDLTSGQQFALSPKVTGTTAAAAAVGVGKAGRFFSTERVTASGLLNGGRLSLGTKFWERIASTGRFTAILVVDKALSIEYGFLGPGFGTVCPSNAAQIQLSGNTWYFDVANETQRVVQSDTTTGVRTLVLSWDNATKVKRLWSNEALIFSNAVDPDSISGGTARTYSILGNGLPCYAAALFDTTFPDEQQLALNPWQLFEPRRIFFPVAAAGGGNTIAVPAGSLSLTGFAPTVTATANQSVAVPAGSLALTSFAPTVLSSRLVQVPAAALTLTAYAPTVAATANQWVNPPAAALTLTGFAPSVLAAGGNVVQVPSVGLTLTGYVPTVTATANQSIAVPAGSLSLTGFAPSVLSGSTLAIPAGSLTLTGFAPTVVATTNWLISVPAGSLVLTGRAPTVSNGETVARAQIYLPPIQLPRSANTAHDREIQQAVKGWADMATRIINDLAKRIP